MLLSRSSGSNQQRSQYWQNYCNFAKLISFNEKVFKFKFKNIPMNKVSGILLNFDIKRLSALLLLRTKWKINHIKDPRINTWQPHRNCIDTLKRHVLHKKVLRNNFLHNIVASTKLMQPLSGKGSRHYGKVHDFLRHTSWLFPKTINPVAD